MLVSKAQLLARMALARAQVWNRILGLPEAALTRELVAGEWTIKDTLAHMAFWDGCRTEQLALMLAGRAAEVDFSDPDPINARNYAQRRGWPLMQVVEELQAARARFLAVVDPLGDDDLERTFTITPGTPVTVRAWIERRPVHDLGHLRPIEEWRASARTAQTPGPACVLRAALDSARSALLWVGELIPLAEQASRPVCGTWTWQDVLGHVADWEYHSVHALRDMRQGQRIDVNPEEEQWNLEHAAARRGEPFDRTWGDVVQARVELLALLDGVSDDQLAQPANTGIGFLSHYYFWYSVCAMHDLEHAESCVSGS